MLASFFALKKKLIGIKIKLGGNMHLDVQIQKNYVKYLMVNPYGITSYRHFKHKMSIRCNTIVTIMLIKLNKSTKYIKSKTHKSSFRKQI